MCAEFLSIELSRAAYKLVKDVLKIEEDEEVWSLLTAWEIGELPPRSLHRPILLEANP